MEVAGMIARECYPAFRITQIMIIPKHYSYFQQSPTKKEEIRTFLLLFCF